jgi:hypothetical protein
MGIGFLSTIGGLFSPDTRILPAAGGCNGSAGLLACSLRSGPITCPDRH